MKAIPSIRRNGLHPNIRNTVGSESRKQFSDLLFGETVLFDPLLWCEFSYFRRIEQQLEDLACMSTHQISKSLFSIS